MTETEITMLIHSFLFKTGCRFTGKGCRHISEYIRYSIHENRDITINEYKDMRRDIAKREMQLVTNVESLCRAVIKTAYAKMQNMDKDFMYTTYHIDITKGCPTVIDYVNLASRYLRNAIEEKNNTCN